MLIMGAHKMLRAASVTGTVDGDSYDPDDLCNHDPHNPVKTPSGSASFTVTAVASLTGINGIALVNTNLDVSIVATFSGLDTVTALPVPENDIRLNPFKQLASPAGSVSGYTLSLSGNSADVTIGEAVAGIFEEVFPLPARPSSPYEGFGIMHPGEFGGMAYSKGGEARGFGGTGLVTDAEKVILESCYRASRENSLLTIIVPFDWADDAWAVIWDQFEAKPHSDDQWEVTVVWREIARLRWPA